MGSSCDARRATLAQQRVKFPTKHHSMSLLTSQMIIMSWVCKSNILVDVLRREPMVQASSSTLTAIVQAARRLIAIDTRHTFHAEQVSRAQRMSG